MTDIALRCLDAEVTYTIRWTHRCFAPYRS